MCHTRPWRLQRLAELRFHVRRIGGVVCWCVVELFCASVSFVRHLHGGLTGCAGVMGQKPWGMLHEQWSEKLLGIIAEVDVRDDLQLTCGYCQSCGCVFVGASRLLTCIALRAVCLIVEPVVCWRVCVWPPHARPY
jgi:hypothetical protein